MDLGVRMGVVVNAALSLLKASDTVFNARCLGSFFKRGLREFAMELKPWMNLR